MDRRILLQGMAGLAALEIAGTTAAKGQTMAGSGASNSSPKENMGSGATGSNGAMHLYQLRIYHVNEGKLPALLTRFRTREVALFEKHGMRGVGFWTPTEEPLAGKTLIYMLAHKDRETADASWKAFSDDPEWIQLKAVTEADGKLVAVVESTFMLPTDFSPLK